MRRTLYNDIGDSTTNGSPTVKLCHVLVNIALCIFGGELGTQKGLTGSVSESINRSNDWGG